MHIHYELSTVKQFYTKICITYVATEEMQKTSIFERLASDFRLSFFPFELIWVFEQIYALDVSQSTFFFNKYKFNGR